MRGEHHTKTKQSMIEPKELIKKLENEADTMNSNF